MDLSLARAADMLATIARSEAPPFLVGFAAETEHVERNARAKLDGRTST